LDSTRRRPGLRPDPSAIAQRANPERVAIRLGYPNPVVPVECNGKHKERIPPSTGRPTALADTSPNPVETGTYVSNQRLRSAMSGRRLGVDESRPVDQRLKGQAIRLGCETRPHPIEQRHEILVGESADPTH